MPFVEYKVYVVNEALGETNPAICTFHIDSAGEASEADSAAQMMAFLCGGSMADNTAFQAVTRTEEGSSGATQVPFPVADFAALMSANGDLPGLSSYGSQFGTGNLTPVGVGITLSLYSAIPGRKTTGRVYTPFTRTAAFTAAGLVGGAQRTELEDYYKVYLLGLMPGTVVPPASLIPLVYSRMDDTTTPVVNPKASARPCRLKTRTR
jgi:hypothetical protein